MENKSIEFSNENKLGRFMNEYFINQKEDPKRLKFLKTAARYSMISAIGIWSVIGYGVLTQEKKEAINKNNVSMDITKQTISTSEEMNQ